MLQSTDPSFSLESTGPPFPPLLRGHLSNDGLPRPTFLYTVTFKVLPSRTLQNKSKTKHRSAFRLVLAREQKQSLIDQYRTHATDTGSPEVKIALLTERIDHSPEHSNTQQ